MERWLQRKMTYVDLLLRYHQQQILTPERYLCWLKSLNVYERAVWESRHPRLEFSR